jgi:hypothetical protein
MSRFSPVRVAILLASLSALFVASGAHAQTRNMGTLTGVVLDEVGKPVAGVEVALAKVARTTRTDSAGKFILALVPAGAYDVTFRRVSYAPMVFMLEISRGDTTEAEVKMNVVAQEMRAVKVEEKPELIRQLDGFEDRRRQRLGHYVTRKEIEDRNPLVLSDMFRMIPGVELVPVGTSSRAQLRFTRARAAGMARGRECPVNYYIDGQFATGYNIDDMPVSDVEGIEVYSGIATLPGQFAKNSRGNLACGTVVIWTRIPGNTKPPK